MKFSVNGARVLKNLVDVQRAIPSKNSNSDFDRGLN